MPKFRMRVLIIPTIFALVVYGTMLSYYFYMNHKYSKKEAEIFVKLDAMPPVNVDVKDR